MHEPDGKNYPNEMVFQKIVAPNKIVMRRSVEPYFTLRVAFEDDEGGAAINWHQDFDNEEVARNIAHIIKPANEQILEKLQAVVASN
jgi:Activator of Hsp90 ATPase homolog 1-like protein